MIEDAETLFAGACPVVASYGGRDRTLRDAPAALKRVLSLHGVEHDIKVHPDAGHGFINDHAPGKTPFWAAATGRLANTGHHESSAADTRRRIIAFFDRHLK